MSKPCVCCWMRNETGNENHMKRSRSAPCACITGRNRSPGTTISCWGVIPLARLFNERRDGSPATGHDSAVCQTTAARDGGWTVSVDGRRSSQAEAGASELSGSAARSGSGRSSSARRSAADQGCAFSQGENAGGLCVFRCAAPSRRADPEPGRGRLLEPKRAGYFSWGNRNGQDALGNGASDSCLSSEKTGTVHDGSAVGERTDGSQEQERTEPRDQPVDALRVDRDRRAGVCRDAGSSRGVVVSDHRRKSGESSGDRYDELAVLGMDHNVPERQVVQGHVGPLDRSGAHHRDRERVVPVSEDVEEKRRRQINVSLCPRPTLRPK